MSGSFYKHKEYNFGQYILSTHDTLIILNATAYHKADTIIVNVWSE